MASRKIGRLPALSHTARTPKRSEDERSLRLAWDVSLGESPITAGGLGSLAMPTDVAPSPPRDHEDDSEDDQDFEPDDEQDIEDDDEEAEAASSSPPPSVSAAPPSRRQPSPARTPAYEQAAGYYETIDFDKITDPFTDTRRAFMRGQTTAPPKPRTPVSPALGRVPPTSSSPTKASPQKRSPSPLASRQDMEPISESPFRAAPPRAPSPVKQAAASPIKAARPAPWPMKASPVQAASPAPLPPRASLAKASPVSSGPKASSSLATSSPAVPPRPRPAPRTSIPSSLRTTPAVPSRSNRLLTEELLKWKDRCAQLEDEVDALQYRLEHVREDAMGSSTDHDALVQQLEEVRRGRENDRKAMRQRVRVLESHMADTKTEYDSRYWRLLISSPDVSSDASSSVQVQLVVQQNQVTRLQAELVEQRRQAQLAREHTSFLLGLYKWRGTQLAQAQTLEAGRLSEHIAHLEHQLEHERAARLAAEEQVQQRSAWTAPPVAPPAAPPAALSPVLPPSPAFPADAAAPTPSPPELQPGMTPMLRRTAVSAADLDVEGTPMLGTRTTDETRPPVRKKKRKLLGASTNLFQLHESATLSPGLDVPSDLPSLPLP